MACVPAPACRAALNEATKLYPKRSRASDGICPSAAHSRQNPTSDHELGNAWDLTHDPKHGVDCNFLAEIVVHDPRIKYVIWNRKIWNPSVARRWRTYNGTNPHTSHMHVSIKPSARNDTSPWFAVDKDDDDLVPVPNPGDVKMNVDFVAVLLPGGAVPQAPYGLVPFWGVGRDGGVFACNGAPFHGSAAGISAHPIVDALVSENGNGYYLLAADGGVFAFGDAAFYGSHGTTGEQPRGDFKAIKHRQDGKPGYHLFVGELDPQTAVARTYTFPEANS